jgi:hypothetical protein
MLGYFDGAFNGSKVTIGWLSAELADLSFVGITLKRSGTDAEVSTERCQVDELEDEVASFFITYDGTTDTECGICTGRFTFFTSLDVVYRLNSEVCGKVAGTCILTAKLLDIVVNGGEYISAVEIDEIGVPLGVPMTSEQGCVGGHDNHIGIALQVCDVECFGEGVLKTIAARSPFAEIYFGSVAVVAVIKVLVVDIPSRIDVVVLVNDVDVFLTCKLPSIFVVRAFEEGTDGAYNLYLGMCGFDASVDVVKTLCENVADEVFVTNAKILEVEGAGMTCLSTHTGKG